MADFHGAIGPVELKKHYVWNRWQGWTVTESWKGRQSEVKNYFAGLKARGAIDVRQEPLSDEGETQWWKITAIFGKTSDIEDAPKEAEPVWTLTGNDIESSLWRLPIVADLLDDVLMRDPTLFNKTRNEINDLVSGAKVFADVDWASVMSSLTVSRDDDGNLQFIPQQSAGDFTYAEALVLMAFTYALMRQEQSYPLSQWVLRKTQVIEPDSTLKLSFENTNRIFTTAGLFAREENPPDDVIPTTLKTDIEALGGFWLKRTPSKEPTGTGKYQVSVEWWWGTDFDSFIYGVPVIG